MGPPLTLADLELGDERKEPHSPVRPFRGDDWLQCSPQTAGLSTAFPAVGPRPTPRAVSSQVTGRSWRRLDRLADLLEW